MPTFLPNLPESRILECLRRSPGNEIDSGKFDSPESSAALVANAFGWFLERPADLPPLPGVPAGQADSVMLEAEMRFPWSGGRHPWLDVGVSTPTTLIGIESKRYEPFRPAKRSSFSDAYDRPVWGENMQRYTALRLEILSGSAQFGSLDAVQLIKHAYGIRTRATKSARGAALVYLYAEPTAWHSEKLVDTAQIARHRAEITTFGQAVAGDDVVFIPLSWFNLLDQWSRVPNLAEHVLAVRKRFGPLG